jgi:hypothetical protein
MPLSVIEPRSSGNSHLMFCGVMLQAGRELDSR